MKKFLLLFPICLLLISCKDNAEEIESPLIQVSAPIYTHTEEDIVNKQGEIKNQQRFEEFVVNIAAKTNDAVRIVNYTTEGDAILKDLVFDGNNIMYTLDTTRDKYGEQLVSATTCQMIEKVESPEMIVYKINECEEELDNYLLMIQK